MGGVRNNRWHETMYGVVDTKQSVEWCGTATNEKGGIFLTGIGAVAKKIFAERF